MDRLIRTHGARRLVLVVEDNEINREILCALLEEEFDVIQVCDGAEGIQRLEEHYRDLALILLDLYMPKCDGFEFLRRKSQDARYDTIPLFVCTASSTTDDEISCLELGANDFVVKPYNPQIMMNRIHNMIRLRESASLVNQLSRASGQGRVVACEVMIVNHAAALDDFRVVESTISLAHTLGLKTVVEGVETAEEAARVSAMGCDYIQGYYYSKPLDRDGYERYLANDQTAPSAQSGAER